MVGSGDFQLARCWGWEIRDYWVIKHDTEVTENRPKLLTSNIMFELSQVWLGFVLCGEIPEAAAKIALRLLRSEDGGIKA